MQTQKVIEQLGYTPGEAKVYLAALTLGECHVSDIAAQLKLPRSSVQAIIDKLHKNGLMNFYVKDRYKYWVAENPEHLLQMLEEREAMVRAALPALAGLKKKGAHVALKPSVKVFVGRDDITHIFTDIIETKHQVLAVIPEDAFLQLFDGTSAIADFIDSRIRHFLRIRMLVPDTPAGRRLSVTASKDLRDVRFLPAHIDLPTASYIYGDKVAFIMLAETQPTAVLIEDPGIRETNTALFEELWIQSGN